MSLSSVYIGIDVACARGRKLPTCVISANCPPVPLQIPPDLAKLIPRGVGNREIIAAEPFREVACGVADAIDRIATEMRWKIERIAVDAPAASPVTGSRASEAELGRRGLASFRTPPASAWETIRNVCRCHLAGGGTASTLPYANKIWMLFGFELFAHLRSRLGVEIIEVYPYAIACAMLPKCKHKSTEVGYQSQLAAIACRAGWDPQQLEAMLKKTVPGKRDDRLDAFMAAWVASLPQGNRCVIGDTQNPDDAIWVPR